MRPAASPCRFEQRDSGVLQQDRRPNHLTNRFQLIAYEVASNGGPSVTNAAASIATQVWRRLLPDAREGIIFVEAYQDTHHRDRAPAVRFAEVTFDLDGDALHSPRWRHRERAEVEALIGGPVSVPAEGSY